MNAHLVDHVAIGRGMVLGRTAAARKGSLLVMAALLVAAAVAAGLMGGGVDIVFVELVPAFAFGTAFQATSAALRARRVLDGLAAPRAAMRHWRRGWAQGIASASLVLVGVSLAGAFWRGHVAGFGIVLLLLPCAVLLFQALAAWAALAVDGHGARARAVVATVGMLAAIGLLGWLASRVRSPGLLAAVLTVPGAIGLAWAGRQLATPTRERLVAPRPGRVSGALVRFLQRRTPWSALAGRRWWWMWLVAASGFVCVGFQGMVVGGSGRPWLQVGMIPWFALMNAGLVTALRPHWRALLAPGAPRRDRLGRHLLLAAVRVDATIGAPLLLLAVVAALLLGHDPAAIARQLAQFVAEMLLALALAVLAVGAWFDRFDRRIAGAVMLGIAGAAGVVMLFQAGRYAVPVATGWPAAVAYDLVLVGSALVVVRLADRAWARRDLGPDRTSTTC